MLIYSISLLLLAFVILVYIIKETRNFGFVLISALFFLFSFYGFFFMVLANTLQNINNQPIKIEHVVKDINSNAENLEFKKDKK